MTVQCCVCRKYRVAGRWKRDLKVEGAVSHTYCPVCMEDVVKDIESKREAVPITK